MRLVQTLFFILSEMLYKCALYLLLILMCYLKFFYANLICVTRFKYVDCLTYKPIGTYYHFFQLRKDFNHFIEVFYQYCPFSIIWVFIQLTIQVFNAWNIGAEYLCQLPEILLSCSLNFTFMKYVQSLLSSSTFITITSKFFGTKYSSFVCLA